MNNQKQKQEKEEHLGTELLNILMKPYSPFNLTFNLYLFVIIIIMGGTGIWVSLFQAYHSLSDDGHLAAYSIATFSATIWATAYVDIDFQQNKFQNLKSLRIILVFLTVLLMVLLITTFTSSNDYAFIPAICSFLIAIFLWCIGNSGNVKFKEGNLFNKVHKESKEKHGNDW